MAEQCPATTRYTAPHSMLTVGVQCKFAPGHDGDHCGPTGLTTGDVFWPQDAPAPAAEPSDEDKIREAMAEAQDHPGRIITR